MSGMKKIPFFLSWAHVFHVVEDEILVPVFNVFLHINLLLFFTNGQGLKCLLNIFAETQNVSSICQMCSVLF